MRKKSLFGRQVWLVLVYAVPLMVLAIGLGDNPSGQTGDKTKVLKKKSTPGSGDDAIPIEKVKGQGQRPSSPESELSKQQSVNLVCYPIDWSRPEWMGSAYPDIQVTPRSFDVALAVGESTTRTMRISNVGGVDLSFNISVNSTGSHLAGGGREPMAMAKMLPTVSPKSSGTPSDVKVIPQKKSQRSVAGASVDWLTLSRTSGTVAPGGSQDDTLTFNSTGLAVGDYNANIEISSNDPNQPTFTVPAHLGVASSRDVDVTAGDDIEAKMCAGSASVENVSFTVTNTGGVEDNFEVAASDDLGWGLNPASWVMNLAPGADSTISCTVTVPADAAEGTVNTITMTASSQFDPGVSDTDWLTITVIHLPDQDDDGICDSEDNCPEVSNADQKDSDGTTLTDFTSYWKFDEGSGTIAGDSAGANDGTVVRAEWTSGKVGKALSFQASSYAHVTIEDSPAFITGLITIEAWIYVEQSVNWQRIVGKYYWYPDIGNSGSWVLMMRDANNTQFVINVNGTFVGSGDSPPNSISLNQWHHVAGSFDGTTIRNYIDGEIVGSVAFTGTVTSSNYPVVIGATSDGTNYQNFFNGKIDEVAIYRRALTPDEIRQHYQNGLDRWGYTSDAIGDVCDNCPHVPNPDQTDRNGDGIGDACEVAWTKEAIDEGLEGAHDVHVADMDGDNILDVVATGLHAGQVVWYRGPDWAKNYIDPMLDHAYLIDVADMDGDGDLDVVATSYSENAVVWYESPGWTKHFIDDNLVYAAGVYAADMDGDGDLDVVASSISEGLVVWYKNPTWERYNIDNSLDGALLVYVIDINGHSHPDVVATGYNAGDVVWYEAPSWAKHYIDTDLDGANEIDVGDMDGDGDLDVVTIGMTADQVVWYEAPNWKKNLIDDNPGIPVDVRVADINGDGMLDIVATGRDSNDVVWYEGPDWIKHFIDANLYNAMVVYPADLDSDGDLDVAATGHLADKVVWYENAGRGACAGGVRGDVNADGNINVLDVLAVVNHILGTIPIADPDGFCRADCKIDNNINVLDALSIVNVILGIIPDCGSAACKPKLSPEVMAFLKSLESYLSAEAFAKFMAMVNDLSGIPTGFALEQNYPNPFNPNTTIRYVLPSVERRAKSGERLMSLHTTLKIYNILGQEVRTLLDEAKEPGYYTVTWDGRDRSGREVASGIYFYRLSVDGPKDLELIRTGRWSETKRMVLLK